MRRGILELAFLMLIRILMQTRILIQRKHAKRARRLQEDDIMSTCMRACFFTSFESKADSGHENHEKDPLELAVLMQSRIAIRRWQVLSARLALANVVSMFQAA